MTISQIINPLFTKIRQVCNFEDPLIQYQKSISRTILRASYFSLNESKNEHHYPQYTNRISLQINSTIKTNIKSQEQWYKFLNNNILQIIFLKIKKYNTKI